MPEDDDPTTRNVLNDSTVNGSVFQASTLNLYMNQESKEAAQADPWVDLARESTIWRHVAERPDANLYRAKTTELVANLAPLRDEAERHLHADPWQDPGIAARLLDRVEWLLGEGDPLDLYPAEAALLVLTPFLYRVQYLRLAAARSHVTPDHLDRVESADCERTSFEAFTAEHELLVKRASLHPEARPAIGWWLFHRWLVQYEDFSNEETLRDLLQPLRETLSPERVSRLLHGLRRGPSVCNPEYLETLPADDRTKGGQRIRDRRLALILALAYSTSIEMAALPQIVVEHLGIPHPVDLPQLRRTLDEASWGAPKTFPCSARSASTKPSSKASARTSHALTRSSTLSTAPSENASPRPCRPCRPACPPRAWSRPRACSTDGRASGRMNVESVTS